MYDPTERRALARELAGAFLEGRWRAELMAERGGGVLSRRPGWLDAVAFAVAAEFRIAPEDRRSELEAAIERFLAAREPDPDGLPAPAIIRAVGPAATAPRRRWPVTPIASFAELSERLELSAGQLMWLADAKGLERSVDAERLRNYRYRWVARRSGLPRLIEAPKGRLKEIQRWILREILSQVPAHDAAHGFIGGRSVRTHATVHARQRIVLRLDLRDFFATVTASRVFGVFRTLGYDRSVAHTLTALCTNAIPSDVWAAAGSAREPRLVAPHFWLGRHLATPHLPQGAPTSPALANLAAYRLDARLAGLSAAFALRYSRYADDLTFSGPRLQGKANRTFVEAVGAIAADEGFGINEAKTTLRTAAQRQSVTGIVVNDRLNVSREDYDRLRATLHRLRLDGVPATDAGPSIDLEAQLRGQVAWVASLNPTRGQKLYRMLDDVRWR